MKKTPLTLLIMDGYGIADNTDKVSAIKAAKTPVLDSLFASCPNTMLDASGLAVGLPDGQMGNSEVGHTNIGAGRVVYQELTRISKAISDGDFFENPVLGAACDAALEKDSALHLFGLCSDGGVHSHLSHLVALLKLAKQKGLSKVFVHCFLDGRDVAPTSGLSFVSEVIAATEEIGVGKVATVMGRYFAMDRDNRFDRVEKAYDAMTVGEGASASDPLAAIQASYDAEVTDEFILPMIVTPGASITADDAIVFFNFRPDRAREITRTFVDPDFAGFARKTGFLNPHFVCFTQYDASMPNVEVAFKPQSLSNTLGEYISALGMTQLRIAETEKYAHVTFFFNGGVEQVYPLEERILVNSPDVATYDLQPEMSIYPVCEKVCEAILAEKYDLVILNFANCDMVGHTGVFSAAVEAVEAVDACVGRVVEAMNQVGGITLITADHGNADQMLEADLASPFTAHTTNPVPFIVTGSDVKLRAGGKLSDIAPTIIDMMKLQKPKEMTGDSLIY